MNTIFDFQPQLYQCNSNESLSEAAKAEYFRLVGHVAEEGLEQLLPLDTLSEEQENALRELRKAGLIETAVKYHGSDGHFYHIEVIPQKIEAMHDSGKRETFDTGAVRDTAEGKPRPDLFSPFAMERVGEWLRLGSVKYTENNWMKGMNYSRVAASLHRHLMKYMQQDTSEDHLAAIIVNASFLMHYDAMIERGILPESLNDLQKYNSIPRVPQNGDEP